jgi:hypothetical protein
MAKRINTVDSVVLTEGTKIGPFSVQIPTNGKFKGWGSRKLPVMQDDGTFKSVTFYPVVLAGAADAGERTRTRWVTEDGKNRLNERPDGNYAEPINAAKVDGPPRFIVVDIGEDTDAKSVEAVTKLLSKAVADGKIADFGTRGQGGNIKDSLVVK